MEFLAALVGALLGGILSLVGGIVTTNKSLKGQRELASHAAEDEREAAAAAVNRETVVTMLDRLAAMRETLDTVGEIVWRKQRSPLDRYEASPPEPEGLVVLRELERLDASRAKLLPQPIGDCWYELVILLSEYRKMQARAGRPGEAWPQGIRDRSLIDVQAYIEHVQAVLVAFIRDGQVIDIVPAPSLSRLSMDPWTWLH